MLISSKCKSAPFHFGNSFYISTFKTTMNGQYISQLVAWVLLLFCDFSSAGNFKTADHKTHCFWTNSITDGQTQYMFLYRSAEEPGRSFLLIDSIWSMENDLLDCIISTDQAVIESYSSKCFEASQSTAFSETPDERFNVSILAEPNGPCVAVDSLAQNGASGRRTRDLQHQYTGTTLSQGGADGLKKLRRSKRAWMIPGTMWCGAGNKASAFSDLGVFEETDKCCREHDHCEETIASFEFGYGVLNSNIFTLSHCDCDNKFRRCLHNASDSISDVVGYGYFNILKMRCFELTQRIQCGQRTWFGMCQFNQLVKYALVKEPTDYNSTLLEQEDDTLNVTLHATISANDSRVTTAVDISAFILPDITQTQTKHSSQTLPDITQTQTKHSSQTLADITQTQTSHSSHTLPTDLAQTETKEFTHTLISTRQDNTTILSQIQTSQSALIQTTGVIQMNVTSLLQSRTTVSPKTSPPLETHIKQQDKLSTCLPYKDLDSCHHQIPALQEKFGLHNPQHITLYHCNCTARLARELMDQNRVDEVHSLLLDFLSQSCFILPQKCTESKSCSSSVPERPLVRRWIKDALLWRHLLATKRKGKRANAKRAKRKDHSFRLYKKCLRMHSKLHKPGALNRKLQVVSATL